MRIIHHLHAAKLLPQNSKEIASLPPAWSGLPIHLSYTFKTRECGENKIYIVVALSCAIPCNSPQSSYPFPENRHPISPIALVPDLRFAGQTGLSKNERLTRGCATISVG
jgi:hypothetical protein